MKSATRATISGFYTDGNYFGWTGDILEPTDNIRAISHAGYWIRDGRIYQKFETEATYVDWWQEQWKGD